jgi:hypothetical protein
MPQLFDTGELALLEVAERNEAFAASATREQLFQRGRDFVGDHPVAAVGAGAAVASMVALVARSPLGGSALRGPARWAFTRMPGALLGAIFGVG